MGYKFLILLSLVFVVLFAGKQVNSTKKVAELSEKSVSADVKISDSNTLTSTYDIEVLGDTLRLDTAGNALLPVGRKQDSGAYFNLKLINVKYAGKDSLLFENGQYFFVKVLPLSPTLHGGLASSYVIYALKEGKSDAVRLYISDRKLEGFRALSPEAVIESWGFAGKNKLVFSVGKDSTKAVYQYNFVGNGTPKLLNATDAAEASVVNALKINS